MTASQIVNLMMKTSLVFACVFLIASVNSQTTGWSSWTDCAASETCFRRRISTCNAGEGIECLNNVNGNFKQIAVHCHSSSECLENTTEMFHASEVSFFMIYCLPEDN